MLKRMIPESWAEKPKERLLAGDGNPSSFCFDFNTYIPFIQQLSLKSLKCLPLYINMTVIHCNEYSFPLSY